MTATGFKKIGALLGSFQYREPETLPKAEFACPKHGTFWGNPLKSFGLFGNDEHIADPDCPKCQQEERERIARREAAEAEEKRIERLKRLNIGKIFWNETLDTFGAYTPELKGHLETARTFAGNPKGKLIMLGEYGNGKTHLAAGILKETGGVMYKAYEIGLRIRQTYNGGTSEYAFLTELCEAPLLVIDEIEKIKASEAKQHWLSYVVGKRYDNMLPMILIGNCHTQDDCVDGEYKTKHLPCPKCIEYHLENDILSRIIEDGTIMKFSGDDYRNKKRAKRGNNA
jgi:DNA replication protein DnaC